MSDQLYNHLHAKGLLTDELKQCIKEYFESKKKSVKMPFGAHKGKTLQEINEFKPLYIQWLVKQSYIKDKFVDIYLECARLLELS